MESYNVGRLSTDWPLSQDGTVFASISTRLQVEWWYPTLAEAGEPDYLFTQDLKSALVTYMGMPSFAISKKEKGVGLRNVAPAPGAFPLVVFNHGFASFSRQNNRQAEALAAAGFVVASLSHPQHSLTTEYSSGEVVVMDPDHPGVQMMGKGADKKRVLAQLAATDAVYVKLASATTAQAYQAAMDELRTETIFALYVSSAEARVDNLVRFVESLLDEASPNAAAALTSHLDLKHINLDQIGLYGHSLGGVIAVAAAQKLQAKGVLIGGTISLDVPQFILPETNPTQLAGNGCFLMGGATKAGRTRLQGTRLNHFLATNNPGFCEINISQAAHQNFTDLSWVTPLKWFGQLGPVSNKKFGRWLNGFVVSYFQHHLQDKPYHYPVWPNAQVVGSTSVR